MSQILLPLYDNDARVTDFFYDKNTAVIYFIKSLDGKKIKFTCKVKLPNIVSAKRYAGQELKRRLNAKRVKITSLIKEELDLWLKVKESEGHKYDTMNNIRRAKGQIAEYWGDKFPGDITRDNITLWYAAWKAEHPKIQMENAIKYMRNFCKYLAEKVVDGKPLLPAVPAIKDPNYKLIRTKRKKKKERIFTHQDFTQIYDAGDADQRVLALLMYTLATRITETLSMRFGEEILLGEKVPVYRWSVGQNKADLWGKHALHPRLIEPLKELRARRKAEGTNLLFPQLRDNSAPLKEQQVDWDGWRKAANIGWHWTPHTFRHTCLSLLFNDSKNPHALICQLYRVSLAVALETYVKPTEKGLLKMRGSIEVPV